MSTSKPPSDLPYKIGVTARAAGGVLAVLATFGAAPAVLVTGIFVATFLGVKKLTKQ